MTRLNPEISGKGAVVLRAVDRQRIVTAVRALGAASRAELGQATGLSRGTVASIVKELCQEGVLHLASGSPSRTGVRGRPAARLSLTPPAGLALVADVGHEHARVVLGTGDGTVLDERSATFLSAPTATEMLGVAAELVADVVRDGQLAVAGVMSAVLSLTASVDSTGTPVTRRYRGLDVVSLSGLSGLGCEVSVVNDANLAALGEAAFGAGRGLDDFIYLKMSYGIGAGLVLGGRLYPGSRGRAGNIGHLRVRDDGKQCRCGNHGCLELVAGARTLVTALQREHGDRSLGLADLIRLAGDGDPAARRIARLAGEETGRVLATVINAFNPAAVLVGGCLSPLGEPLFEGLREAIRWYGQPSAVNDLEVLSATCGDRAEVLGGLAKVFLNT